MTKKQPIRRCAWINPIWLPNRSSLPAQRKRLAPSKISGPLVFLGRYVSWPYLKFALKFQKIEIRNAEAIVQALTEFQQGRTRLIIAFRHPYGDEPQLLFHVFERMLPRCARKLHKPLKARPRMRPVHDYAVALWGDAVIRFILPRVGALPVYHTKIDTESLNAIRRVMRDGPNPLDIASEGQISYHAETLPRIEQGTIRMGLWCARDLEKEGRPEQVMVLPLSVHYRYQNQRDTENPEGARAHRRALRAQCAAGGRTRTDARKPAAQNRAD